MTLERDQSVAILDVRISQDPVAHTDQRPLMKYLSRRNRSIPEGPQTWLSEALVAFDGRRALLLSS